MRQLLRDNLCSLSAKGNGLENPSSYGVLAQEIHMTLRSPIRSEHLALAILGDEALLKDFDLSFFINHFKLNDFQVAILAIALLCHMPPNSRSGDLATKELMSRFQALSRQIGLKGQNEESTAEEIACLARQLLLNSNCSKILSAVQKFVVEYALFQRYQIVLPPELISFFAEYNAVRQDEDRSKSLAQLFDETCGAASSTLTSVTQIFTRLQLTSSTPNVENQIADLIVTIINSIYPVESWDGDTLGRGIHKSLPDIDWTKIVRALDCEDLGVVSMGDLNLLLTILKGAISAGRMDVPVHFLWGAWHHTRTQAYLLRQLTQAPASIFNITEFGEPKVLSADNFVAASSTLKNLAAQLETSPWNSLDLLKTSLRLLSDDDAAHETKLFLEAAGKTTPELIFLGCVQLPHPWGAQQEQLSEKGCEVFFAGQPNHQLVFYRLWQVDPEFLCRKFVEYHTKDSLNIGRILDIAQDLRILDQLLNLQPYAFAVDLAALASRRECLNIEKWLDHNISTGQDAFLEACLRYLSFKAEAENLLQQSDGNNMLMTVALTVETVAIFLKALMNTAMSPENGEFLKQVQSACLQVYPRLMNSTNANRDPTDSNNFAKDVEKEVEFYYGRLYEGEMSISVFVEMLQNLKRSTDVRDQDVFACMLHSLFDEYRFFADYPLSALSITAVLFGNLIQNQLLSYIPLGIALRYILDAVGHEPESNMFKFGVQALNHFKDRVSAWPQYCEQILGVSSLAENEPDLINAIRSSEQRGSKPAMYDSEERSELPTDSLERPVTTRSPFHSLHPVSASRDPATFVEPSVETSDKILFNINNMSLTNLSEKLDEVKSVLTEEYYAWFACHLVSQRAAVEPNYHSLYIHFLEAMQDDELIFRIILETIENISLLLNSDNTITSTVERTNLKNLGSWLGGLTLARNKPLKHKLISLKDLLLEGFDGNRLIVVLPFVCRVLEQTTNSKVFRPPCPWTMAVLGLLMELYESADMKLNLKFEVEVLCKKLDIHMSEVQVSTILRNRPIIPEQTDYLNEGLSGLNIRDDSTRRTQVDLSLDQSTAFVTTAVAEMPITIHPIIQQNFAVPNLRRLLMAAAERAVREFILPVVERSVAVASISTSQLVSKDFALEEDINKFRRAAHTMNQNLAGSLALVTCKEPLRNAFTANLRILLAQSGFEGLSQEGETLLSQLINDNLDVTCMIVEKAATERAISEIDEGLSNGYQARRKHFESRNGQNFSDVNAPRHAFPLPNPLRLKSSGLTPEQMSTYDDFARIPRTAQEAANYYAKEESRPTVTEQESLIYRNEQQSLSAFEQVLISLSEVDGLARELEVSAMDDIPIDSALRTSLQQIPLYLSGLVGTIRDERTLTCSQRVCQLLFKVPYHELSAQCLTLLLNSFIELSMKTYRDVSIWLVHSEDPRKYNIPVIQTLMRAQIIVPSEFDVQLAKQINLHKPAAVEFGIGLMSEVVLGSAPVALRTDFTSSLDALDTLAQSEQVPGLSELFELLQTPRRTITLSTDEYSFDDLLVRDQLSLIFMEWVHLISHPTTTEKMQFAYVLQLQNAGITINDDLTTLFFRCIIEQSIESAIRMMPVAQNGSTAHYLVIDAVTKLIVLMLKSHSRQHDSTETVENFRRILGIAIVIFAREHDTAKTAFNQKPFFRFFASLFSEMHTNSISLSTCMQPFLSVIAEELQVLQPLHYPGFTFSWMTLISHRLFMPKLLDANQELTWPKFRDLISCILSFLAPFLKRSEMPSTIRVIYHATLRILLVLLNDFPSFLDEFSYTFMNIIP